MRNCQLYISACRGNKDMAILFAILFFQTTEGVASEIEQFSIVKM